MARFTKLQASINKIHVPLESVDTHFAEQHASLQAKYECDTVFTDTGDTYTLHIHRHDKLRMTPSAVQRALSDRYDPPEQFKNVTGVVMKKSGDVRTHGGARKGVLVRTGGGSSDKKNDRYEDFELVAIGQEEYKPDTNSIASALSMDNFYQTIECFGGYLQMASFGNHNFSCSNGRAHAKYLPDGAPCWLTTSKKTVCRAVCMAWVTKLTEIVDGNNGLELDQEAVTEFKFKRGEYLEGVASDSRVVALGEKRCVEAVSETAKSLRDVHAQDVGKKVRLIIRV